MGKVCFSKVKFLHLFLPPKLSVSNGLHLDAEDPLWAGQEGVMETVE